MVEEVPRPEVGDHICPGRTEGSRQVEAGSCDLPEVQQEACRGSRLGARLGNRRAGVLAEEEEGGNYQGLAGSYQEEGSRQGSQWLVGNLGNLLGLEDILGSRAVRLEDSCMELGVPREVLEEGREGRGLGEESGREGCAGRERQQALSEGRELTWAEEREQEKVC